MFARSHLALHHAYKTPSCSSLCIEDTFLALRHVYWNLTCSSSCISRHKGISDTRSLGFQKNINLKNWVTTRGRTMLGVSLFKYLHKKVWTAHFYNCEHISFSHVLTTLGSFNHEMENYCYLQFKAVN